MIDVTHQVAKRMNDIQPFHVMALLAKARELEALGQNLIHMEIGEPDFGPPRSVTSAAVEAMDKTYYTPAAGLPALREAIAEHYKRTYGVIVDPQRIIVTPGASGALQLVLSVLINPADKVLMTDPGYPCNKHFVRLVEGHAVNIPVDASTNYQLTLSLCQQYWDDMVRAVMLASPSNPTGTLLDECELQLMIGHCAHHGAHLIVDEIYHGLVYEARPNTSLAFSENIFVINSFSKYFGMTGWRVGWLVVPTDYVADVEKLAQNIFLAASSPGQFAALAALEPKTLACLDKRCQIYKARRDYLVAALIDLGFSVPKVPQGAFYVYAGCEKFSHNSYSWAYQLLEHAGVVITPGIDFGCHQAQTHVRFAYTTSLENLEEGIARLRAYLCRG